MTRSPQVKSAPPEEKTKSSAQRPPKTPFNPVWARLALGIQPKLTVGAPDDAFEREADQVADQVMRMPEPDVAPAAATPRVQRLCAECEEEMQAKEEPGQTPGVPTGFEQRFTALHGGGQPLPTAERAFFEPRFGRDFAGVRLHSGPAANELARSVQARAFTLGDAVVFGAGQYAPGSGAGRQLLAHELTHVVQQGGGRGTPRPPANALQRDDAPPEKKDEKKEEKLTAEGMDACDISPVTKECNNAAASCSSVAQECSTMFPTVKDMDDLEKKYRGYVSTQKAKYPNAAANLEHFLDHSGTTQTLPASLFKADPSVQGVLETHREKFIAGMERRLKAMSPLPTTAQTVSLHYVSPGNAFGIPYTDLGLAVGGYQLCSVADVTATPAGTSFYFWKKFKISFANWKAQAFDCYNWDPGKAVAFVGNDKELCCLQNSGRGKHFLVKSDRWDNTHAPSLAEGEVSI